MTRRVTLLVLALCTMGFAQRRYEGPRPPTKDLPYLKHATTLIPTEAGEAREEKKKDDIIYVISGLASTAKTPLASPILLIEIDKLPVEKFALYRLESRNGRRELVASPK